MNNQPTLRQDVLHVTIAVTKALLAWAVWSIAFTAAMLAVAWLLSLVLPEAWVLPVVIALEVFTTVVAVGVVIRRGNRANSARWADDDAEWLPFTTPSVVDRSSVL